MRAASLILGGNQGFGNGAGLISKCTTASLWGARPGLGATFVELALTLVVDMDVGAYAKAAEEIKANTGQRRNVSTALAKRTKDVGILWTSGPAESLEKAAGS